MQGSCTIRKPVQGKEAAKVSWKAEVAAPAFVLALRIYDGVEPLLLVVTPSKGDTRNTAGRSGLCLEGSIL